LALKKPLLALVLSLVIALSIIALINLEKSSTQNFNLAALLAFPTSSNQPLFEDIAKQVQPSLINNSTRMEIYNFITANPGIQFRGICTGLSIAIGTAEFHLGVLKKAGLISFVRDGKYKRFFPSGKFTRQKMELISLLRHKTTRNILNTIVAKKTISRSKLASTLSISSQGLTWQMNRLRQEGLIQENFDGIKVNYSLKELISQALPELLCMTEQ
jgi:predicted transcriptional regulator